MSPTPTELANLPIGEELRGHALDREELDIITDETDITSLLLDIVSEKNGSLDVRGSVIDASVELSVDGAHELTITVHDPDKQIYRSGILDTAIDLNVRGWWWRLARHTKSGRDIALIFEPRPVAWLRSHKSRMKSSRSKSTRAEFIHKLVRQIKIRKVGFICPEEHKKQTIEGGTRDTRGRKQRRESGLDEGHQEKGVSRTGMLNIERALVVGEEGVKISVTVVTGSPPVAHKEEQHKTARRKVQIATVMCILQESKGLTSATNGIHVGLYQQDPRYWPATRDVEKDSKAWYAHVIAADTEHPELSYIELIEFVQRSGQPHNYAQWEDMAKRIVDSFRGGGESTGSLRPTRVQAYQFYVKKDENHYGCAMRLADDVNWRLYTIRNDFHLESETHLMKSKSRMKLTEGVDGIIQIDYDRDGRRKVQEVTVTCYPRSWGAPVGTAVIVDDGGPADDRYMVSSLSRPLLGPGSLVTAVLRRPVKPLLEPTPTTRNVPEATDPKDAKIDFTGGAKEIVEQAVSIARGAGGPDIFVVSAFRGTGDRTSDGNLSDHGFNDENRAARDIAKKGVDAINGPPSAILDEAVAAIGDAFGRDYGNGKKTIIDTFNTHGFRIQILWRTPKYGGHMGHIHVGARKA